MLDKAQPHRLFHILEYGVNALLAISLAAVICGAGWELSTRSYLAGFADAVVPKDGTPEEKVESILGWMDDRPAPDKTTDIEALALRDPRTALNNDLLLQYCGTATVAFLNVASRSGLRVRRLLLLDSDHQTKHVVAEVWLHDRWAVVDPTFRILFRDSRGEFLTKEELRDPAIFQKATRGIPGYVPMYSYESTEAVRLERIPIAGAMLRPALNWTFPGWDEELGRTLILDRDSLALVVLASVFLFFSIVGHFVANWYAERRLHIPRMSLRIHLWPAGSPAHPRP